MTTITTSNGTVLDFDNENSKFITNYANEKGLDLIAALATLPNRFQNYVLIKNIKESSSIIYGTNNLEAMVAHIDMLSLKQDYK